MPYIPPDDLKGVFHRVPPGDDPLPDWLMGDLVRVWDPFKSPSGAPPAVWAVRPGDPRLTAADLRARNLYGLR